MADPRLAMVRRQVVGRLPPDGREAWSRAAIPAELDGSQAPFDQRSQAVHVTGSAVVLGPDGVLRAGQDAVPAPVRGRAPNVRWFPWVEARAVADSGLRALLVSSRPTG
ncbi:MAG: hypothetical protein ACYC1D_04040 [Acidimicrobiales bacterium]